MKFSEATKLFQFSNKVIDQLELLRDFHPDVCKNPSISRLLELASKFDITEFTHTAKEGA